MQDENKNTNVIFSGTDGNQPSGIAPVVQQSANLPQSLDDPVANGPQLSPSLQPPIEKKERIFVRLAKRADVVLAALLILGSAGIVLSSSMGKEPTANSVTSRFDTTEIPLDEFSVSSEGLTFGAQSVVINGSLEVKDGLIIAPSVQPTSAVAGQMYYDQTANVLSYYNGSSFVSLSGAGVQSVGGLSGQISIGGGLSVAGGQLTNTGVLSVQGTTGNVNLTAGGGISINGTTISNSGIVSVASSSPTIVVTNDGSGNITLSGSGAGTVSSPGGTTGSLPVFTGAQTIADSVVSQSGTTITVSGGLNVTGSVGLSTALTVANGGTGATSLTANGVLVGQGTGAITSVTAGGSGLCLLSTVGAPAFSACPGGGGGVTSLDSLTGALTIANSSGAGTTITIDNASTSAKGIAQFNSSNFSVSTGTVNTIQDIGIGATPTFVGVNTNTITPSSALTLGATGQTATLQGSTATITSNGAGNDITLNSADTIELQDNTNVGGNVDISGTLIAGTADAFQVSAAGAITAVGVNAGTGLIQGTGGANISGATISLNANSNFATNINTGTSTGTTTIGGGGSPLVIDSTAFDLTSAGALSGITTISTSGTINSQTISSAANFTGTLTVQGSNALTLGVTGTSTGAILLKGSTAASGTITLIGQNNPTGSQIITLPDATGTVCLTTGNCAGSGTGVTTGGGATNRLAKFTALQNIENSTITDDGSNVTTTADLVVQGGEATIGMAAQQGSLLLHDGNGETATIRVGSSLAANTVLAIPSAVSTSDTFCLLTLANCSGAGSGSSLQAAYNAGNSITTTSSRDIAFTLDNNSNFTIVTEAANNGFTTFSLTDGSNATPPAQLVLLRNNDTNQPVAAGLKVTSAAGGITTAIDVSGTGITNAIAIGGNAISGTSFSVTGAGAVTAVGVNAGAGLIQGTAGLTITGATASLNAGSNFATNINTGSSTGTITIGGGSAPLVINSTNFDVDSAGAVSGVTTLSTSSTITLGAVGTADTTTALCRNSSNQIATCTGTGSGAAFVQGGNDFNATAVLGTTDADALEVRTNGAARLTVGATGGLTVAAGNNLSLASGTGTFSQTYTGTSTNAHTVTANSLTSGGALRIISSNNSAADTAWMASQFDITNAQGTTAVSTGSIAGLDVQFTQNTSIAGNTETLANFAIKQNDSSSTDATVSSILNLTNNDTATGNQITVTDGLKIVGSNVTNGINLSGTFGTNLITSSNFSVSQAGAIVGVGVNAGTGQIQGTGGLSVSGATIDLNVNSNFATNINTGTSTGTVTIGGGSSPLVINSTNFDVSSAGAISGITGYAQTSGNFLQSGTGTFGTGSGAVSLNGDTAIASTKTLTVTSGLTSLTGNTSGDALNVSNSTSTGNIAVFNDNSTAVLTLANGGSALFRNQTNSATALQVQNATGADTLLTVDTTARSAGGGNLIKIGNSTGTDTDTTFLVLDGSTADPSTNIAALNGGMFYDSDDHKVKLIENGQVKIICNTTDLGCGTGTVTLQSAYDNGNTILTTNGRNIDFDLADTATDPNFLVDLQCDTSCSTNGRFAVQDDGTDVFTVSPAAGGITLGDNTLNTPLTLNSGTGTIAIGTGAQARTLNFGTGAGVVQSINVGGTGANVIAIGDTQTGGSISLGAAMTSGTINVGGTGAQTGTIGIGTGTGAQTVNLATGAGAKTVALGSTTTGTTVTILASTGTGSGDINIGDQTTAAKRIDIGSVSNAGSSTINIATAAADQDITMGSTASGSSLTLNAGTGNAVLNATSGTVTIQTTTSGAINIKPVSADGTNIVLGTASDNIGTLLVLDEKNAAGDPTGANGGMYYNSGLRVFRCYEGGYWRDCLATARTTYSYTVEMTSATGDHEFTFDNSGGGDTDAGSGNGATGHPGIVGLGTNAALNNWIYGGSRNGTIIRLGNGDYWRYEAVTRIPTLSNGTNRFSDRLGFIDGVDEGSNPEDMNDGCFFKYSDNVNSGRWQGVCMTSDTSSTCDTGITVAANTWYRLTLAVNSAGNSVDFMTDGTSRCQVTTNIPTGSSNVTGWGMAMNKDLGSGTSGDSHIDYISVEGQMGTSR